MSAVLRKIDNEVPDCHAAFTKNGLATPRKNDRNLKKFQEGGSPSPKKFSCCVQPEKRYYQRRRITNAPEERHAQVWMSRDSGDGCRFTGFGFERFWLVSRPCELAIDLRIYVPKPSSDEHHQVTDHSIWARQPRKSERSEHCSH